MSANQEILSFTNIVNSHWQDLANKTFTNIETNENLGWVYAKYNNTACLTAICTNGRIEFNNGDYIKQIFGENLDVNKPLFKVN